MCKKKIRNSALYLLFLINCASAIKNGVDWLFCVAAALTAAVLTMDMVEAVRNERKK